MKKVYSVLMLLAMMVAALSFTACGGDDDDVGGGGNRENYNIVGVWEVVNYEANFPGSSIIGDRMYFNADGTYRDPSNTGTWTLKGNNIIVTVEYGNPTTCVIESFTGNEMTLRINRSGEDVVLYLKRVTDEEGGGSADSYIQVKIDGKTYKEAIPEWCYAQIDPFGSDSQGNKLTHTYDMAAHFEDTEGFLFMFGITHYRKKDNLLASSPGSYPFAKSTADDEIYNNLAFSCLYELDGDEYDAVSGTHQVKSIKSVGSDVCVEGSFTAKFKYHGDTKDIQGNYSILSPF